MKGKTLQKGFAGMAAGLLTAAALYPLVKILLVSFSSPENGAWFTLQRYEPFFMLNLENNYPAVHILVSLLYALTISAGSLVPCLLTGFLAAKWKRKRIKALWFAVLVALLAPLQLMMVPALQLARDLHTDNTWASVVLPNLFPPFGIFLMAQFARQVPEETLCAALMETHSVFHIMTKIVAPQCAPALLLTALFTFCDAYGAVEYPLIMLQVTDHILPFSLQVNDFIYKSGTDVYAGGVLYLLPMCFLFALLLRPFLRAFHSGQREI